MSDGPHADLQPAQSLRSELKALLRIMPPRRRWQLGLVLALMILAGLAELATIGAVLPFLSLLAEQDALERFPWMVDLFDRIGADSATDRLIAVTILFGLIATGAGATRLLLAWTSQRFVFGLGHDYAVEVLHRMLLQPYSFHIGSNSSELLAAMEKVETMVSNVLLQLMMAVTAAFIAGAIVSALLYVDPFAALVGVAAFSLIYLLISAFARRSLSINSAIIGATWHERVRIAQESLGGIRDVIIDGSQRFYVALFREVDRRFSRARARTVIVGTAPRYLIEIAGTLLIVVVAVFVAQREGGLASAVPILGALALGAQRLLPLLQQIYHGWSIASGHRSITSQVLHLLQLPATESAADDRALEPLPLKHRISIESVNFSYPANRGRTLENVTLEIRRGSKVALIGRTGSGKSTLADLIMGLLEPGDGRILIDGIPLTGDQRLRWQRSIAHVPQSIFLADTSIARNIALGVPADALDMSRIEDAANRAQLAEFVASLPDGFETQVGERGVRLSGGQRQRLGIARALYKQTQLLVLDEATSALDVETEEAVMRALDELAGGGITIITIAHRHSPAMRYDQVVRLDHGRIVETSDGGTAAGFPRTGSS